MGYGVGKKCAQAAVQASILLQSDCLDVGKERVKLKMIDVSNLDDIYICMYVYVLSASQQP